MHRCDRKRSLTELKMQRVDLQTQREQFAKEKASFASSTTRYDTAVIRNGVGIRLPFCGRRHVSKTWRSYVTFQTITNALPFVAGYLGSYRYSVRMSDGTTGEE
jgi:hypothetical protein